jgi:hypothetical protein
VHTDPDAFTQDDDDDNDDKGHRGMSTKQFDHRWSDKSDNPPRSLPTSIQVKKSSDSHVTSATPELSSSLDMSMTEVTAEDQIHIVKRCVKNHVFSIWKFYAKEFDSQFSHDEKTMCGFIMKHTKFRGKDHNWWLEMRRVVVKTHTDLRNNVIKNMQTKFKGKQERGTFVVHSIALLTHYLAAILNNNK